MKRIRAAAAEVGLGLGVAYLFFLIPQISALFAPDFVLLVRQVLAMSFAVSLAINPHKLVEYGQDMAPKIQSIISIITGNGKSKDNTKD